MSCISRVIRWLLILLSTTTTYTTHATRVSISFGPLIAAKAAKIMVNSTAGAGSCHDYCNVSGRKEPDEMKCMPGNVVSIEEGKVSSADENQSVNDGRWNIVCDCNA